ncbi:MAG: hypothetical protein ABIJ25_05915 [Pseudomonadota bacterium]
MKRADTCCDKIALTNKVRLRILPPQKSEILSIIINEWSITAQFRGQDLEGGADGTVVVNVGKHA